MKTTFKIDSVQYTCTNTPERISEVKTLHAKFAKSRRKPTARHGTRVYPKNGADVSVKRYVEAYFIANSYIFVGTENKVIFAKKQLDLFFAPLSINRCYAQGEYSEEKTA